jgi:predicted dehydrogenase
MGSFDDTFRNRLVRFVEQVLAGDPPDAIDGSGADGLAAQKILAAAIESIRTGQNVNVRDFCDRKGYRS